MGLIKLVLLSAALATIACCGPAGTPAGTPSRTTGGAASSAAAGSRIEVLLTDALRIEPAEIKRSRLALS